MKIKKNTQNAEEKLSPLSLFSLFVRAIFVIARIHSLNFVEQFLFYLKLQSI